MKNRILTVLAAVVTLVILGAIPAAAISGPYNIKTHSGNKYCLGGQPNRVGTKIIQLSSRADPPQCRDFWFSRTNKTPGGNFSVGNFQTISARAELGAEVNSTGQCTGKVRLSAIGAKGTAWILYTGVAGKMFLSPPVCEGGIGKSDCQIVLSADNVLNHQWTVGKIGNGTYQSLDGLPLNLSKQTVSPPGQRRCCVC